MGKGSKGIRKVQEIFTELADITKEMGDLIDREDNGEDIDKKETESIMGIYMYKLIELNTAIGQI